MARLRVSVIGLGVMGRKHVATLALDSNFEVIAVCGHSNKDAAYAKEISIPYFSDYGQMLERTKLDGVIIAVPNQLHLSVAAACIKQGIPTLLEKPVADTMESARALIELVERTGVPVLVGHHRRYNPILITGKKLVEEGQIGAVVAVMSVWLASKPPAYFEQSWRHSIGGGPLLINAIHDIDCLRMLCGEIDKVQAIKSSSRRSFSVEDTAGAILHFASGAIGTYLASDSAPSPWSWELSSQENPVYPHETTDCYYIAGARGSLAVPSLQIWRDVDGAGWTKAMHRERVWAPSWDPFVEQLRHFSEVIRGVATPRVSITDATRTLATTLAITRSAASNHPVAVAELFDPGNH